MILTVPHPEAAPWPTLGPLVCKWIEKNLVFGPGDLRGQPARLDAEKRALLYRAYEVFPKDHPKAGRRRFRRVAISLRKGSSKTEFAAWIAAAELHPTAPVRCVGWDSKGRPKGGGVRDAYVPIVSVTEEQTEELAYGALRVILGLSPVAGDFDIGLERIMRKQGDGKAVALASAPDARDGARTTFQIADESHRWNTPRLRAAHRTMLANLPKRRLADPWAFEITTAPCPGEDSVAERTMEYAQQVADGRAADSELFFFHRQAADRVLYLPDGTVDEVELREAVLEASGPVAEWSDIDGIVAQWRDPTADRSYLERVWLNRLVRAADRAFDASRWRELGEPGAVIADGAHVALGFDGSRRNDATALIATEIATGLQNVVGLWERPVNADAWEVPEREVSEAVRAAFERWKVWRLYADPPYWEETVANWAGEFGDERVILWRTNQERKTSYAVRAYRNAIANGELKHSGDAAYTRHVGNAFRRPLTARDDLGERLWVIQKERQDSPNKIDAAMAGVLSWQARLDALAEGVGREVEEGPSVYDERAERGEEEVLQWV